MRSKTMQRRQLIGAAATAGSVTIAPALLTGCAAAPKSEPAATVATLPEGASAHVTAVAPTGAYRGCVLDGTGVRRWLGIPFIKNPYEPVRRYLKPEPYGAHEGVMDCLKHGSIPLQPNPDKNVEKKMVGGDGPLCLNIWAPKAGENLPVMVWVPGGGSISCAQNDERFDGTNFARDGVVLVTLAYRVNVDGFLKLRGGDSGNGNRDILEGLRWVKANIAAFGGDPDKITAFGQSAGGTHLVDVIASPYTKGLLAGAVIQSPSAVAQWRDAAQAEEAAKLVCDAIGCEPTREAMLKIPNERLAAFGSLAGRLAKNAAWARSTNGNIALFKAYVGDDFMPVRPVDAIAAGACEGLAVITGSTRSEWRHYIVPNGLIAKVNEATVKALCVNAGLSADLPEAYRRAGRGSTPGDVFAQIQSDIIFRMPCVRLMESLRRGGATVWAYSFDWESPVEGKSGVPIGAAHSNDVPFVFDNLDAPRSLKSNGADAPRSLAYAMHSSWVEFAKTQKAHWPEFEFRTRRALSFTRTPSLVSDPWAFERLANPAR